MTIPIISIKNAALAYCEKVVFSHLSIDLPAGRWIGLLGPSGVGKSSFLKMLAGLTSKENAQADISLCDNSSLEQQVAYMAQTDLLLPWLNVRENATLHLRLRHYSREKLAEEQAKADHLLAQVGLNDALKLYPHQLSGGMRQRVALVRTLMENKPIILMDEPFSALDSITRYKLQELAANLLHDKTVLFVTHDPTEALRLAHDIYIMHGSPAKLKNVAQLTSDTPRKLDDPLVTSLQALLFQELTQAVIES